MIISYIPVLIVDILGSALMVILSVVSLHTAKKLRNQDPDNTVFLYLLWICTGFTIFAVSRSIGHILRQLVIFLSIGYIWTDIAPYTGTINTVSFFLVGLITLFFEQIWKINVKISSGREELEAAHSELVRLNQSLERQVVERTERLTASEYKCRRIFDQSLDIILVTDADFKILEINPTGVEMTGYSKNEIIINEMPVSRFFASDAEWDRIRASFLSNEFILNEETDFIQSNGITIRVLITGAIDYGAFGCEKTFHFIIKNINEKKQMEQQIAQADKLAALGELSAGIAHEINNPLGIILGYTQLMIKQELKNNSSGHDRTGTSYEDLKTIEKHVKTCKTIVSDLLAFSRKGSSKKTVLNINNTIQDVVKFLTNHSDFRNIEIKSDLFSDEVLLVSGNEQELRQVMINLMINACHAMEKNGLINIKTEKNDKENITIKVKDNGRGISKMNLSKIFDPFFTTKPVGQGTGLGLSVSYGIIKKHNGSIKVKSREGEWTVFTIVLPAVPHGEEAI